MVRKLIRLPAWASPILLFQVCFMSWAWSPSSNPPKKVGLSRLNSNLKLKKVNFCAKFGAARISGLSRLNKILLEKNRVELVQPEFSENNGSGTRKLADFRFGPGNMIWNFLGPINEIRGHVYLNFYILLSFHTHECFIITKWAAKRWWNHDFSRLHKLERKFVETSIIEKREKKIRLGIMMRHRDCHWNHENSKRMPPTAKERQNTKSGWTQATNGESVTVPAVGAIHKLRVIT